MDSSGHSYPVSSSFGSVAYAPRLPYGSSSAPLHSTPVAGSQVSWFHTPSQMPSTASFHTSRPLDSFNPQVTNPQSYLTQMNDMQQQLGQVQSECESKKQEMAHLVACLVSVFSHCGCVPTNDSVNPAAIKILLDEQDKKNINAWPSIVSQVASRLSQSEPYTSTKISIPVQAATGAIQTSLNMTLSHTGQPVPVQMNKDLYRIREQRNSFFTCIAEMARTTGVTQKKEFQQNEVADLLKDLTSTVKSNVKFLKDVHDTLQKIYQQQGRAVPQQLSVKEVKELLDSLKAKQASQSSKISTLKECLAQVYQHYGLSVPETFTDESTAILLETLGAKEREASENKDQIEGLERRLESTEAELAQLKYDKKAVENKNFELSSQVTELNKELRAQMSKQSLSSSSSEDSSSSSEEEVVEHEAKNVTSHSLTSSPETAIIESEGLKSNRGRTHKPTAAKLESIPDSDDRRRQARRRSEDNCASSDDLKDEPVLKKLKEESASPSVSTSSSVLLDQKPKRGRKPGTKCRRNKHPSGFDGLESAEKARKKRLKSKKELLAAAAAETKSLGSEAIPSPANT